VVRDVRVELCAEGQPIHEPLEADVSREQFEEKRYRVGQKVGVRFRRWQVHPADVIARPTDADADAVA
jgi:hypothetical protein